MAKANREKYQFGLQLDTASRKVNELHRQIAAMKTRKSVNAEMLNLMQVVANTFTYVQVAVDNMGNYVADNAVRGK